MNALRQAHLHATARNLGLFHSLSHTLRALDDRQIPVIVLKGAHLAALEYEDIGPRSMGDVNLLVRRHDLGKALEVLEYLGYRQPHDLALEPEQVGTHHLPPLVRSGAPMLELHWALLAPVGPMARLVEPFAIDQDAVWRRSEQATIAGAPARVFSSVDLLLHLSVHLVYQHALQFGVRTASDIDALVRRSGVERDRLAVGVPKGSGVAREPLRVPHARAVTGPAGDADTGRRSLGVRTGWRRQ